MIGEYRAVACGGVNGKMLYTIHKTDERMDFPGSSHNKRYIYVLLLRYPDTFSTIFRILTRCKYNHASIGVNDSDGVFYSYVTNGFRKELPQKHPTFKRREVPCKLYRVEISQETYNVTRAALYDHEQRSHRFKYNILGVILCLLRFVWPIKNRYFCSQFVSEVLAQVGAVPLEKHSALYLPDDFTKQKGLDLCFSGYLSQLVKGQKPMSLVTA